MKFLTEIKNKLSRSIPATKPIIFLSILVFGTMITVNRMSDLQSIDTRNYASEKTENTIEICEVGCEYVTLQDAINAIASLDQSALADGVILNVGAGKILGNMSIDTSAGGALQSLKNLTIKGKTRNTTTLIFSASEDTVVPVSISLGDKSSVTIEDMTFDFNDTDLSSLSGKAAFNVVGQGTLNVTNTIFQDGYISSDSYLTAVDVAESTTLNIENTDILRFGKGFYFHDDVSASLKNVSMIDVKGEIIVGKENPKISASNLTSDGETVSSGGITLSDNTSMDLSEADLFRNIAGLTLSNSASLTVNQSRMQEISGPAIIVGDNASLDIRNSLVKGNQCGILVNASSTNLGKVEIVNNNIVENLNCKGIIPATEDKSCTIDSNCTSGHLCGTDGKCMFAGAGVFLGGGKSSILLRNNIIVGNNSYGIYAKSNTSVDVKYNDIWQNIIGDDSLNHNFPSLDSTNISDDPVFVGADTGDYTLANITPPSPCIDTGDPELFDANGSRSDMGMFGGGGESGSLAECEENFECSDDLSCTDDACVNKSCVYTSTCQTGQTCSSQGTCVTESGSNQNATKRLQIKVDLDRKTVESNDKISIELLSDDQIIGKGTLVSQDGGLTNYLDISTVENGEYEIRAKPDGYLSRLETLTIKDGDNLLVYEDSFIPGDLTSEDGGDGDNIIKGSDLSYLINVYLTEDRRADLNGDGIVNSLDSGIIYSNWFLSGE